eukprot:TRINITY_DN61283_c0_g1_i1.p1 TRINITY_DN61283_c0_g1~~TRINITY_DN61283_c0_g1_i1.p1  ORF type:complete len:740 (+),score=109.20 TRINITY_DN61283_c0_g1_i1:322-2220(+)
MQHSNENTCSRSNSCGDFSFRKISANSAASYSKCQLSCTDTSRDGSVGRSKNLSGALLPTRKAMHAALPDRSRHIRNSSRSVSSSSVEPMLQKEFVRENKRRSASPSLRGSRGRCASDLLSRSATPLSRVGSRRASGSPARGCVASRSWSRPRQNSPSSPLSNAAKSHETGNSAVERAEFTVGSTGPRRDLYELFQVVLDTDKPLSVQQDGLRQIQQLLRDSPEPPNSWSGSGTPLSTVVKANRIDITRLFLRARADPNDQDDKGVSALHLATFDGNVDMCRTLLLSHAEVDVCDRHGQTPLFFAPTKDMCKLLLESRADVSKMNRRKQTALHVIGRAGLSDVLMWLTSRVSKSLVDLRDVYGATAWSYAEEPVEPLSSTRAGAARARGGSTRTGSPIERIPSFSELVDEATSCVSTRPSSAVCEMDSHDGSSRDGTKGSVSGVDSFAHGGLAMATASPSVRHGQVDVGDDCTSRRCVGRGSESRGLPDRNHSVSWESSCGVGKGGNRGHNVAFGSDGLRKNNMSSAAVARDARRGCQVPHSAQQVPSATMTASSNEIGPATRFNLFEDASRFNLEADSPTTQQPEHSLQQDEHYDGAFRKADAQSSEAALLEAAAAVASACVATAAELDTY